MEVGHIGRKEEIKKWRSDEEVGRRKKKENGSRGNKTENKI